MIDYTALTTYMGDLEEDKVLAVMRDMVENEPENVSQAMDALSDGMQIVGERFDTLEYFVGDLIYAGEVFSSAMEVVRPLYPSAGSRHCKVILATVEGDLHDIGKNMVKVALEAKSFEVIDLGVNVAPDVIARRTKEEDAPIVALSAVLTLTRESMARIIEALSEIGIRDRVAVVIGGAGVNAAVARDIGADMYCSHPDDTVAYCLSVDERRRA